jgi:acyl CoA:acetate/3-ketoacid CoA transferase
MNKIISLDEAVDKVNDGDTVMVGGFLGVGTPEKLIDALVAKGTRDLTLICNDTAFIDRGSPNFSKRSSPPILEPTKKPAAKCWQARLKWNWFPKAR